jgi:hypothetical protein
MPSRNEVEAAAKALARSDDWSEDQWNDTDGPPRSTYYQYAEAALTAAERVRNGIAISPAEARTICEAYYTGSREALDDMHKVAGRIEAKLEDRTEPETGRPEVERLRGVVTDLQRHLRNAEKVERRRIVALIEGRVDYPTDLSDHDRGYRSAIDEILTAIKGDSNE